MSYLSVGLPGVGKSLIMSAIMTDLASCDSGISFYKVKCSDIYSRWFGDSEKFVDVLFTKAREAAPCIIFFDEIDALFRER